MEISKNQKIITASIVVLVLVGLYFKMNTGGQDINNNSLNLTSTSTPVSTTTTNTISSNSSTGPGYKIEQVPINPSPTKKNIPMPDLNRPVIFASNLVFTDEVKTLVTSKIQSLQQQIKNDPVKLLPWIDLGMYQKMAGDYEGAKISWKYVSDNAPTDFISLGNLGNLYAYYLKDNAMAENYYKLAISKDPKQVYLYIQLAEVYRDVFSDNDKANGIIDEGLKKIPGNEALLEFKNSLK